MGMFTCKLGIFFSICLHIHAYTNFKDAAISCFTERSTCDILLIV